MEEELDLRPYVSAAARRWWLILGIGLLFGILAYLVAASRPTDYQASALVAVLEPTQQLQFDPRFENVQTRNSLLRAYPELARSDEILQALMQEVDGANGYDLRELRDRLTAQAGNEPSLLYLRARHPDPAAAAELANRWAETFVDTANNIYGTGNVNQLAFYETQLEDAGVRLAAAEEALVDFQAANRLTLVTNELTALTTLQSGFLTGRGTLQVLLDDIASLQEQASLSASGAAQLSEQLTALSLQSRAYGIQGALPVVLQVDAADIASQDPQQQAEFLAALQASIEERLIIIEARLAELEPQILDLQEEQQELSSQGLSLQRDHDLLAETYTSLARKVDEEIIASQDTSSGFRLASRASVPTSPSSTNPLILAVVGFVFGAVLASLAIILWTWWRQ